MTDGELLEVAARAFDRACEARDLAVVSGAAKDVVLASTAARDDCRRLVEELQARIEVAACV